MQHTLADAYSPREDGQDDAAAAKEHGHGDGDNECPDGRAHQVEIGALLAGDGHAHRGHRAHGHPRADADRDQGPGRQSLVRSPLAVLPIGEHAAPRRPAGEGVGHGVAGEGDGREGSEADGEAARMEEAPLQGGEAEERHDLGDGGQGHPGGVQVPQGVAGAGQLVSLAQHGVEGDPGQDDAADEADYGPGAAPDRGPAGGDLGHRGSASGLRAQNELACPKTWSMRVRTQS